MEDPGYRGKIELKFHQARAAGRLLSLGTTRNPARILMHTEELEYAKVCEG